MARISENYAPYAPTGNVLGVIQRLREAGLPEVIDNASVTRVGVSEGNASRTVAALQFLGLITEEGRHTDRMETLRTATTEEYPGVLGDILQNAYHGVLQIVNLDNSSEVDIDDAFRSYQPAKQRARMVTLFIGLAQEANLIAGEPTTINRPTQTPSEKRAGGNGSYRPPSSLSSNTRQWFEKLEGLIEELPDIENPQWTVGVRQRWLNAFTSFIDYKIEIIEGD